MTRSHMLCRPTQLKLDLPGEPRSVRARDGATYEVVERSAGLAVVEK